MPDVPSLAELRERLHGGARAADAAIRLDALRDALEEEEVGNILAYVGEHLGVETLDGLLERPDAQRILDGALSPGNRRWVLETLAGWIGDPQSAPRRHRPAPLPEVPDLPVRAEDVPAWAADVGVLSELDAPAKLVRPLLEGLDPFAGDLPGTMRIGDLIARRGLPTRIKRQSTTAHALADAARAFLRYRARVRKRDESREHLWSQRPADASLRALSVRLHDALRSLDREGMDRLPVVADQGAIGIEDEPPRATTQFVPPRRLGRRPSVRTSVFFDEGDGPARSECSCDGDDGPGPCAHRRILIAQLLDCVHDPKHPLRDALRGSMSVPSWQRLLDAIDTTLNDEEDVADDAQRVAFRVTREAGPLEVQAVVQKRQRNGRWSKGAIRAAESIAPALVERDAATRRALDALHALEAANQRRASPAHLASRRTALARALEGHPHVFAADAPTERVALREAPLTLGLEGDEDPRGMRLRLRIDGQPVAARDVAGGALHAVFDRERGRAAFYVPSESAGPVLGALAAHDARFPSEALPALADRLTRLQDHLALDLPRHLRGVSRPADATPLVRLEPKDAGTLAIAFRVRPAPSGPSYVPGLGAAHVLGAEGDLRVHVERDFDAELREAEALEASLALPAASRIGRHSYLVRDPERALGIIEALSARDDLRVEWPAGAARMRVLGAASAGDLRVQIKRTEALLGIEGGVEVDGAHVPLAALLDTVRAGKRFVSVGKGRFVRIADALRAQLEEREALLTQSAGALEASVAAITALAELAPDPTRLETDDAARSLLVRARDAEGFDPSPAEDLGVTLRPYQRDGYAWLARLTAWGAGGILADEMGLGKTMQALALARDHLEEGPILVVCPMSVLATWSDETARVIPKARVRVHHGKSRSLDDPPAAGDLLLTSYDVLVRDIEPLAELQFALVIFDEAHLLKNPRTRRARAAARLVSHARVALTGTPLENHLGELYGVMHAANPGLLGPWDRFRDRFAGPIERSADRETRQRLMRRIRPFMLRRTKRQVTPDLPPRTEVLSWVELGESHRLLYDAARDEALANLTGRVEREPTERFSLLAAITRLRQLACHPRLVDPTSRATSSKMNQVLETLRRVVGEGHRVLIFSQFVSHLELLREALDREGREHLYLDGSTRAKQRAERVKAFQEGAAPIFLISLKAGGTGLTLTAADYVFHLDPWWNPAVEDQASDRAHRIGQDKPVTIVRFVSLGTIEEAVVALHREKRELADAILEDGDRAAALDGDALLAMVKHGARASLDP